MNESESGVAIRADAVETAEATFRDWQSGQQQAAIDRLRPRADKGEPWAVGLLTWLYIQQGIPGFERAVPYARRAHELGLPGVAANLFNHIIGNIPNAPQLVDPALSLLSLGPLPTPGPDLVASGWNLLQHGQPEAAVRLMGTTTSHPATPEAWRTLVADAQAQAEELDNLVTSARARAHDVDASAQEAIDAITGSRTRLETEAKHAQLLVTSINSESANALFNAEAERNADESRSSWRWGVGVLVLAACITVLPLVLHYFGTGPEYSSAGLLAAHTASSAALGTVAGVLLARARGRDRARQRARDLSTAMGTMISYSNQIQDDGEKQRFMLTMGQLVLQAHLQGDRGRTEDVGGGLLPLVAAMRQPPPPA